jgi:hypothetical protein
MSMEHSNGALAAKLYYVVPLKVGKRPRPTRLIREQGVTLHYMGNLNRQHHDRCISMHDHWWQLLTCSVVTYYAEYSWSGDSDLEVLQETFTSEFDDLNSIVVSKINYRTIARRMFTRKHRLACCLAVLLFGGMSATVATVSVPLCCVFFNKEIRPSICKYR